MAKNTDLDTLLKRINELANKQKTLGLTDEEKEEQKEARAEYIQIFRNSVKSTLNNIDVVDHILVRDLELGLIQDILEREKGIVNIEEIDGGIKITYNVKENEEKKILNVLNQQL